MLHSRSPFTSAALGFAGPEAHTRGQALGDGSCLFWNERLILPSGVHVQNLRATLFSPAAHRGLVLDARRSLPPGTWMDVDERALAVLLPRPLLLRDEEAALRMR